MSENVHKNVNIFRSGMDFSYHKLGKIQKLYMTRKPLVHKWFLFANRMNIQLNTLGNTGVYSMPTSLF